MTQAELIKPEKILERNIREYIKALENLRWTVSKILLKWSRMEIKQAQCESSKTLIEVNTRYSVATMSGKDDKPYYTNETARDNAYRQALATNEAYQKLLVKLTDYKKAFAILDSELHITNAEIEKFQRLEKLNQTLLAGYLRVEL